MRLIYRCETCGNEFGTSDIPGQEDPEKDPRDALTGYEGEGIMNDNKSQNVFNSLCTECREEIWGRDSSIPFFGNTFKH